LAGQDFSRFGRNLRAGDLFPTRCGLTRLGSISRRRRTGVVWTGGLLARCCGLCHITRDLNWGFRFTRCGLTRLAGRGGITGSGFLFRRTGVAPALAGSRVSDLREFNRISRTRPGIRHRPSVWRASTALAAYSTGAGVGAWGRIAARLRTSSSIGDASAAVLVAWAGFATRACVAGHIARSRTGARRAIARDRIRVGAATTGVAPGGPTAAIVAAPLIIVSADVSAAAGCGVAVTVVAAALVTVGVGVSAVAAPLLRITAATAGEIGDRAVGIGAVAGIRVAICVALALVAVVLALALALTLIALRHVTLRVRVPLVLLARVVLVATIALAALLAVVVCALISLALVLWPLGFRPVALTLVAAGGAGLRARAIRAYACLALPAFRVFLALVAVTLALTTRIALVLWQIRIPLTVVAALIPLLGVTGTISLVAVALITLIALA
jgi:hypothetical protein